MGAWGRWFVAGVLSLSLGQGMSLALEMPADFQKLRQQVVRSQSLQEWVKREPKTARDLQSWLLSDALFARLHQLPTLAPDSKELLKQLSSALPGSKPVQEALTLLDQPDFHNQILSYNSLQNGNHELWSLILSYGQGYLYPVDHLPRIEAAPPVYELYDRMSFLAGMEEGEFSPDALLFKFYVGSLSGESALAFEEYGQEARQHGLQALAALARLEQGIALLDEDEQEAVRILDQVLGQAQALQNPLLEFRILLSQAKQSGSPEPAQTAKALLDAQPPGFTYSYLLKLWADYLLQQGQVIAARGLYTELASQNEPWLLVWLLRTFARMQDSRQLPLVETLIRHPHPLVAELALRSWIQLSQGEQSYKTLPAVLQSLPVSRRGELLAQLPLMTRISDEIIASALSSEHASLQSGALKFLQRQSLDRHPEIPFQTQALMLLKSPDTEVQLAALAYLSAKTYAPALLTPLSSGSAQVRAQALQLLQKQAEHLPAAPLKTLLQDPSAEVRLEALAVLVLKGERKDLADFLTLWQHERFGEISTLGTYFAQELGSGRISWQDWRKALDQHCTPRQPDNWSLCYRLFAPLEQLSLFPDQGLRQLDSLLFQPNPELQQAAISALTKLPRNPGRSRRIAALAQPGSDGRVQAAALHYLAYETGPEWLPLFRQALRSKEERLRHAAWIYLVNHQPDLILSQLEKPDSLSREDLVSLLRVLLFSKLPPEKLKPLIRSMLTRSSPSLRRDLIAELSHMHADYLDADLINEQLRSPRPNSSLLERVSEQPALLETDTLRLLLHAKQPDIRATAILLTVQKGERSLFKDLLPLLQDKSMISTPEHNPFRFIPLTARTYFPLRELALRSLLILDRQSALPLAEAFLRDPDVQLQTFAKELLSKPDPLQTARRRKPWHELW